MNVIHVEVTWPAVSAVVLTFFKSGESVRSTSTAAVRELLAGASR